MSQQINLLQRGSAARPSALTPARIAACGVLAAAVLMCLWGAYEHYRVQGLEVEAKALETNLKEMRTQHDRELAVRGVSKADPEAERRLAELELQLKSREDVVDALKSGFVGSTTGFSSYLLALSRRATSGVWLTAVDIAAGGQELTLAGRALNPDLVPVYLQRLTQEAPLQGRRFASMVISHPPAPPGGKEEKVQVRPPYIEFRIASAPSDPASGENPRTDAVPAPKTKNR